MAQFPANDAPQGTPPNYVPQAWAVRYTAPARPVEAWNHTVWRKYGTKHHAEAGIRGMRHFPPSEAQQAPMTRGRIWKPTPMVVELWEFVALSTQQTWRLVETRVYRDGEVFVE